MDEAEVESDGRFPSGEWTGYYVQWGQRGRQDLVLTFREGKIGGCGSDAAGDFAISGEYSVESGRAALRKRYPVQGHTVEYDGLADGAGIAGDWVIRYLYGLTDRGTFRIWPVGRAEGAREEVEAEIGAG